MTSHMHDGSGKLIATDVTGRSKGRERVNKIIIIRIVIIIIIIIERECQLKRA